MCCSLRFPDYHARLCLLFERVPESSWRPDRRYLAYTSIKRRHGFPSHVWAIQNESREKGNITDGIKMVDPLEAKRLAAKQLQEIQAKEKLKIQRRLEAINGAWAMVGLIAGLVVEGQTGKSILSQLADYWNAFISFFIR
ncbi:hypothetical protein HPP92_018535 [Vanilla planifolia]|uniref:Uncharacterized protein n=1 Tax=Vanilla planifolia TaxID=51239 RepID=A0A835Q5W8_VANPL|nr:hypothetical protein HPP92_018535 [Vanilla planifolia]